MTGARYSTRCGTRSTPTSATKLLSDRRKVAGALGTLDGGDNITGYADIGQTSRQGSADKHAL